MKTYFEKLKDPRWQKKRLEVLNERDFKCEECSNDEEELHVHHGWYEKNSMPWEYPNSCFIVLCKSCHSQRHDIELKIRKLLPAKKGDYLIELSRILKLTDGSPSDVCFMRERLHNLSKEELIELDSK